jgi:hypothetical protein
VASATAEAGLPNLLGRVGTASSTAGSGLPSGTVDGPAGNPKVNEVRGKADLTPRNVKGR